jgi:hypothetical protein
MCCRSRCFKINGEKGRRREACNVLCQSFGMVGRKRGAARHAIHDISFRIDKGKGGSEETSDSSRTFREKGEYRSVVVVVEIESRSLKRYLYASLPQLFAHGQRLYRLFDPRRHVSLIYSFQNQSKKDLSSTLFKFSKCCINFACQCVAKEFT